MRKRPARQTVITLKEDCFRCVASTLNNIVAKATNKMANQSHPANDILKSIADDAAGALFFLATGRRG